MLLGRTGACWSRWGGLSVTATRQVSPGIGAWAFGVLVGFVSKGEEAGAKVQPFPSWKDLQGNVKQVETVIVYLVF